jgi:DNA anti-recombination protein RmuC
LDSKRLSDRISGLVEKATATQDPTELEQVLAELTAALREHIQRVRKMASAELPGRRRTDFSEE